MPKRIENGKEDILRSAKAMLLLRGYDALTIRGVAADCGIAVGTVYNYFPSKDMLAAAVMLEDWRGTLCGMQAACGRAVSVSDALDALYAGLTAFCDLYRGVWAGYRFTENARSAFGGRRGLLVRQLAECLLPVLARRGAADAAETAVFLAENLLVCTGESDMTYTGFLKIIQKLLPDEREA